MAYENMKYVPNTLRVEKVVSIIAYKQDGSWAVLNPPIMALILAAAHG